MKILIVMIVVMIGITVLYNFRKGMKDEDSGTNK